MIPAYSAPALPQAFIWRRLHSLMGIWLVLYLIQHLLVNSQAALFIGEDGAGFIKSVNAIHDLPYLPVIEMVALGFPLLVHAIWGIKYLFTSKMNSFGNTGTDPYLPEYSRNRAYTWQRITSWLLIVGILAHVIHMRYFEYPIRVTQGGQHFYLMPVTDDEGLATLAPRLNVRLYDPQQIQRLKKAEPLAHEQRKWIEALEKRPLAAGQVMTVANSFGTAELLMLRNTFKMPIMLVLYTLLVLFTSFHAFNGLWTGLISWGVTLTARAQRIMLKVANLLMLLVTFLGLAAVWLTYWVNLRH
jgi:succinate dehydrogenase / fumarate reductase cytochrome b subunit